MPFHGVIRPKALYSELLRRTATNFASFPTGFPGFFRIVFEIAPTGLASCTASLGSVPVLNRLLSVQRQDGSKTRVNEFPHHVRAVKASTYRNPQCYLRRDGSQIPAVYLPTTWPSTPNFRAIFCPEVTKPFCRLP